MTKKIIANKRIVIPTPIVAYIKNAINSSNIKIAIDLILMINPLHFINYFMLTIMLWQSDAFFAFRFSIIFISTSPIVSIFLVFLFKFSLEVSEFLITIYVISTSELTIPKIYRPCLIVRSSILNA